MNIETQLKIRNNPNLYHFLRENSWWYKEINRNPESINEMQIEMKNYYKMNLSDQIDRFGKRIEMIRTFMDIMK